MTFPTTYSAIKASNALKKMGISRLGSWGSNPYSDTQSFDHYTTQTLGKKVIKLLTEEGWTVKETPGAVHVGEQYESHHVWHTFTHPDGGHVDVMLSDGKNTVKNRPYSQVTTWGSKKAKPTTIPYYD